MSMKETIHRWVESLPEDSPRSQELYEEAHLALAIEQAEQSVRNGRTTPIEEVIARFEEKCRVRHSA
jgi:hypothetical protein